MPSDALSQTCNSGTVLVVRKYPLNANCSSQPYNDELIPISTVTSPLVIDIACVGELRIFVCPESVAATTDLPRLHFTGGPTGPEGVTIKLTIGNQDFVDTDFPPTHIGGRHWLGMDQSTAAQPNHNNFTRFLLSGRIAGDVADGNGNPSGIDTAQIARFDVGGTIDSSITCETPYTGAGGSLLVIETGSTSSRGNISIDGGDATRIRASTGNIAGNIRMYKPFSRMRVVRAEQGNISGSIRLESIVDSLPVASPGTRIDNVEAPLGSITSQLIRCSAGSTRIAAGHGINAGIRLNYDFPNETTTGGLGSIDSGNGNLAGTLEANFISDPVLPSITVGTNLTSSVTIQRNVSRQIAIGGSVLTPMAIGESLLGTFSASSDGLAQNILVNFRNSTGLWNSAATVGTTALTGPPYYPQSSSTTGGGAIGLAPYRLYESDCFPRQGATDPHTAPVDVVRTGATKLRMRFYGPVYTTTATPLLIEWYHPSASASNASGPYWLDMTSAFSVARDSGSGAQPQRTLNLVGSSVLPYGLYRASIASGGVRCLLRADGTTQTTDPEPVIKAGFFYFYLFLDCNGNNTDDFIDLITNDCNHNGIVDICENPPPDPANCSPVAVCAYGGADWDYSGSLAVEDIFAYMNDWFAGVPRANFNHSAAPDPIIETQDLFDYLAAWFGGCQ